MRIFMLVLILFTWLSCSTETNDNNASSVSGSNKPTNSKTVEETKEAKADKPLINFSSEENKEILKVIPNKVLQKRALMIAEQYCQCENVEEPNGKGKCKERANGLYKANLAKLPNEKQEFFEQKYEELKTDCKRTLRSRVRMSKSKNKNKGNSSK